MTTYLLDANVVIALSVAEHEHHAVAGRWFADLPEAVAVCPVVEGALLRFIVRMGESVATARAVLVALREHPRVEFWPDDASYLDVPLTGLRGHRQLTDAYLAGLAARRGGRLATLDAAAAAAHPDSTTLLS